MPDICPWLPVAARLLPVKGCILLPVFARKSHGGLPDFCPHKVLQGLPQNFPHLSKHLTKMEKLICKGIVRDNFIRIMGAVREVLP